MQAGDNDEVKGAGALESGTEAAGEVGAVAGEQCGEHGCVFRAGAEWTRQGAGEGWKGLQAVGGGVAGAVEQAGDGAGMVRAEEGEPGLAAISFRGD